MADNVEIEETELDADSLRPAMVSYLKTLEKSFTTFMDDEGELIKLHNRISLDRQALALFENKLIEHISHVRGIKAKTQEIGLLMQQQLAARI